jgi:hypothetical protein
MHKDGIVWLLPLFYAFHLIEEYYGGEGLPSWLSDVFSVNLSQTDFLAINAVAFTIVLLIAILHAYIRKIHFIVAVVGIVFFLNGIIHTLSSLFTMTYSPGMISGILLYIPLGILIYRFIFSQMEPARIKKCILLAALIHILVAVLAFTV